MQPELPKPKNLLTHISIRWLAVFIPYATLLATPALLEFLISSPTLAVFERIGAGILVASWLALAIGILPTKFLRAVASLCITSCLLLMITVEIIHFGMFRHRANDSVFLAIANTHLAEALEFTISYLRNSAAYVALGVIAGLFLWSRFRRIVMRIVRGAPPGIAAAGTLLSVVGLLAFLRITSGVEKVVSRTSLAPTILVVHYREALAAQRSLSALGEHELFPNAYPSAQPSQQTYVLVLGESTARGHLGIYGYPRDTTAHLAALKENLVVFDNVLSPHCHTHPSVRAALGFSDPDESNPFEIKPTIIDLMNEAGFKTFWISNQVAFGRWNTPVAFLAKRARVVQFLNPEQFRFDAYSYDDVVLGPLEQALKDPSPLKFIVVHLRGAHAIYRRRYPSTFPAFSDSPPHCCTPLSSGAAQTINEYDTAVSYQDSVVASAIKLVNQHTAYSAVLFLSDHGEELFDVRDYAGHNESMPSPFMFEIPLMLWTSKNYQLQNGKLLDLARAHKELPYNTASLAHTLQDLTGVHAEAGFFQPQASLLNPEFKPQKDRVIQGIAFGDSP
jgi:heptose-I-phosphate ethanolaminephosphotransferase